MPIFSVVFAHAHVVLLTTEKSHRAEKKFHNARSLQENNARSAANQSARTSYCSHIVKTFNNLYFTDENDKRSMVEPASLENPKVKELQEVTENI